MNLTRSLTLGGLLAASLAYAANDGMKNQTVAPPSSAAAAPAAVTPSAGGGPAAPVSPIATDANGKPKVYQGLIKKKPEANKPQQPPASPMSGMPPMNPGAWEPKPDTDWDKFEYNDKYKFNYGGVGAGNIGNGLCTAKNKDRTQVKNGYCAILIDILTRTDTCANREMKKIIQAAGQTGSGVRNLTNYCSSWSALKSDTQQAYFFQQLLAGLITQESGWREDAHEVNPAPGKGGRGLFQIGTWDAGKDPDCGEISSEAKILSAAPNIKCGACIALTNLAKDMNIGQGTGDDGAVGMARYFGPFRDAQSAKREAIAGATSQWCRANTGGGSAAADATPITSGGSGSSNSSK